MFHGLMGALLSSLLCSEGGSFLGTLETSSARGAPRYYTTRGIGNTDNSIVKCRLDVHCPGVNVLSLSPAGLSGRLGQTSTPFLCCTSFPAIYLLPGGSHQFTACC